jgi:hypothetical protein
MIILALSSVGAFVSLLLPFLKCRELHLLNYSDVSKNLL